MAFCGFIIAFFESVLYRMGILQLLQQPKPIALGSSKPPIVLESSKRPIAFESSKLGKLSRELIHNISSFLPLESAASFTLCCRPTYFILGTQYLKALKAKDDYYKFLNLLELDLPNHILCHHCQKLHAIDQAQQYIYFNQIGAIGDYSPCVKADITQWTFSYVHNNFSTTILRMATKRYRQGLDCSKLLKLVSCKARFRYASPKLDIALARIVPDGALLIRIQHVLAMPKPTSKSWNPNIRICPHIHSRPNYAFTQHRNIIYWEYDCHPERRRVFEDRRGILPCDYCLTEFRVELKSLGNLKEGICGNLEESITGNLGEDTGIVVTKWQDFGEGQSHLDVKWQSHLKEDYKKAYLVPVTFDSGSICARFEGGKHDPFEYKNFLSNSDWTQFLSSFGS